MAEKQNGQNSHLKIDMLYIGHGRRSLYKFCFFLLQVYLLPDKSKNGKRKTKVKKHTLNPVFDESIKYYMSLNSLESRTLWLTVWHSDMFGRNDFLGEVTINLQGKVFDNSQPQWYSLQERVIFHIKSYSSTDATIYFINRFIHSSLFSLHRVNHSMTFQRIVVILLLV